MMPRYLAQPCPLPPPTLLVECMMSRCMAQPCPLSLSFLLPHEVVRGLGLFLDFMFEVGRRGGGDDAAESGTAVPAPSLLAACTCCCVLLRIGPFGTHV